MPKCFFLKNVSGSNGTLISYMDLISSLKYEESPHTNADVPAINTILQPVYSLDFKKGVLMLI